MKQLPPRTQQPIWTFLALGIFGALFSACSAAKYSESSLESSADESYLSVSSYAVAEPNPAPSRSRGAGSPVAQASLLPLAGLLSGPTPDTQPTPVQPYLVKTMNIALQVDDVAGQAAALQAIVAEMDGYLANMTETTHAVAGTESRLTLRIPAIRLEEALGQIEALGEVLSRNLSTTDVTLQYVDMASRLRNLEKTEGRLLAHLERSGEMAEILSVEKEIDRVRSEIETYQGRMNDLSNQIAFATVEVYLRSTPQTGPIQTASAISTGKVFGDALRSMLGLLQGIWYVLIWVVVWSPIWGGLAFAWWIGYRRNIRAKAAKA